MARRKPEDARRVCPVRVALQNQRDTLLAFAGLLDDKLANIARVHAITELLVRDACVLHCLPTTSPAYWQGWNRLQGQIGGKFHTLFDAVSRAMADTPRSSALVENLNSRLRSRRAERQGKSPRKLMTGQGHPHWLILLGMGPLQPRRA